MAFFGFIMILARNLFKSCLVCKKKNTESSHENNFLGQFKKSVFFNLESHFLAMLFQKITRMSVDILFIIGNLQKGILR